MSFLIRRGVTSIIGEWTRPPKFKSPRRFFAFRITLMQGKKYAFD